jgi:transposase
MFLNSINQIVGMRIAGMKYPEIAAITNIPKYMAQGIYDQWVETGACSDAPRSGHPKLLVERDVTHLRRHVTHNRNQRRQSLNYIMCDL